MSQFPKIPEPLSINDKYLHGINVRLEALIEQMSVLTSLLTPVEQQVEDAPVPVKKPRGKRVETNE